MTINNKELGVSTRVSLGSSAMNWDFRGLQQSPIKSDGLWSCPFADGISLLGARPRMLAGKVS
jgi:hypothetical protein